MKRALKPEELQKLQALGATYQDPRGFDFSKLKNFIPLDQSILKDEHTITNCPARRYSIKEGYLSSDGCHNDRGDLEFRCDLLDFPGETYESMGSLVPWLSMWLQFQDVFYAHEVLECLEILAKHNMEMPAQRFQVCGTPWPGASSPGVIIDNTFLIL